MGAEVDAWFDTLIDDLTAWLRELNPQYRRIYPPRFRERVRKHFLHAFPTIADSITVARDGREGVVATGKATITGRDG